MELEFDVTNRASFMMSLPFTSWYETITNIGHVVYNDLRFSLVKLELIGAGIFFDQFYPGIVKFEDAA